MPTERSSATGLLHERAKASCIECLTFKVDREEKLHAENKSRRKELPHTSLDIPHTHHWRKSYEPSRVMLLTSKVHGPRTKVHTYERRRSLDIYNIHECMHTQHAYTCSLHLQTSALLTVRCVEVHCLANCQTGKVFQPAAPSKEHLESPAVCRTLAKPCYHCFDVYWHPIELNDSHFMCIYSHNGSVLLLASADEFIT